MNIFWFIVWLIGAIVSTYVTFKYAEPLDMYKRILKFNNRRKDKIIAIAFLSFAICGYTILSWIGALATYVIFNDFNNR